MNIVAYYRVSTKSQGESGLGLEAQEAYVEAAAKANGWNVVAAYTDTVSGSITPMDRPECKKAFSHNLPVVVAKLDRLSRSVADIAVLMTSVQFKVATMPHADTFQLHLFAALAEQERQFISARTTDALAALKDRAEAGDAVAQQKIANRSQALQKGRTAANMQKAREAIGSRVEVHRATVQPHIEACLFRGCKTLQSIADCLNSKGVRTSRGGEWNATQVRRVMRGLQLAF